MKIRKKQKSCCVAFCGRVPQQENPGISFHRFPGANELVLAPDRNGRMRKMKRALIWRERLRTISPLPKYVVVCSEHFHDSDFLHSSKNPQLRFMKKTALPTRHLPQYALIQQGLRQVGAVTCEIDASVMAALPMAANHRPRGFARMQVPIEVSIPLVWPTGNGIHWNDPSSPGYREQPGDSASIPPGMILAAHWHRAGITLRVLMDIDVYAVASEEHQAALQTMVSVDQQEIN